MDQVDLDDIENDLFNEIVDDIQSGRIHVSDTEADEGDDHSVASELNGEPDQMEEAAPNGHQLARIGQIAEEAEPNDKQQIIAVLNEMRAENKKRFDLIEERLQILEAFMREHAGSQTIECCRMLHRHRRARCGAKISRKDNLNET